MKNNNLPMFLCLCVILSMGAFFYILGVNQRYKYVCFNTDIEKDTLITEEYLSICTSRKKISNSVITEKSTLLSEEQYISYKVIKDYKKDELLYKEDFVIYEYPKYKEEEIELLTELKVASMLDREGNHIDNSENLTKYNIYIKNQKLYATNLNTGEIEVIFDTEEVKNIAVRPMCCTGNGNLLILTTSGNVYISENDCNYFFNFNFPFKKMEATNIVNLKLVPAFEGDIIKNLYGINSLNEDILLQKIN